MVDLKKYTHILWDYNGTLLDDAWLCVDVMNGMLGERGMPLRTLDEYREMFDFPVRDYYVKLGYDFDKEPFDIVGMEFIDRYNIRHGETLLHPEVKEVLSELSGRGFSQNILSAREQAELLLETSKLGINHYFDRIRGLNDHYAHGKTDVGHELVREIATDISRIIFIGDTLHDAEVASELGVDCLLVPNGHQSEARLRSIGVPIIHTLSDLIK